MMQVGESGGRGMLSFEFFPPKDAAGEARLWDSLRVLGRYNPDYVSVTYGAGGSDRARTLDLVLRVKREITPTVVAHLTCVGDDEERLCQVLDVYRDNGLCHLLALRGDRPESLAEDHESAFPYADHFVSFIRRRYGDFFTIGVASYPEKHPEAASLAADLDHFQRKVEAGASFAVTQFFFDNDSYFRYVEKCRKRGLHLPIIPGIMPVTDFKQIRRFAQLCGSVLPEWLVNRMEALKEDKEAMRAAGIEIAIAQCQALLAGGAPGLHLFTLNRHEAVSGILEGLQW